MKSFLFLLILLPCSLFAQTREAAQKQLAAEDQYFNLDNAENTQITASWVVHAASENDQRLVGLYLDAGTPVDAKNKYGLTALIVAAQHHFDQLVDFLLSKNANANAADNNGRTALHEALALPYEYTSFLFGEKPEGYAYDTQTQSIAKSLLAKKANANAADANGVTPLMIAAQSGNETIVRMLLQNGGDASVRDHEGKNAFDNANSMQHRSTAGLLLEGKLSFLQRVQLFAWKFSRWSGALALLLIVVAFLLARSARKGKMAKQAELFSVRKENSPRLLPIRCESCGSGIPLKAGMHTCPTCNAPVKIPPEYEETLLLREKAARQLHKAEIACKRASFLSAPFFRVLLWLIGPLWLALTVYGYGGFIGKMLSGYEPMWWIFSVSEKPDIWTFWTLLGSVIISAGLLYYASFLGKVHRTIPTLPRIGKTAGKAEIASCHNCGGTVEFAAGSIAASCSYCGAETLRTDVAQQSRNIAAQEASETSGSLTVAMQRLTQLQQLTWGALQRPLWGIVALLACTLTWAIWGFVQWDWLMTVGWIMLIPAMLFLTWTFAKSFRMNFWLQALLLVATLVFFAWASLLAGLAGAFVGVVVLGILLPVLLIFLKIFSSPN